MLKQLNETKKEAKEMLNVKDFLYIRLKTCKEKRNIIKRIAKDILYNMYKMSAGLFTSRIK